MEPCGSMVVATEEYLMFYLEKQRNNDRKQTGYPTERRVRGASAQDPDAYCANVEYQVFVDCRQLGCKVHPRRPVIVENKGKNKVGHRVDCSCPSSTFPVVQYAQLPRNNYPE